MNTADISSTKLTHFIRPPSLRPPKSGLLMAEARKIPESARPADLGLNPCAFCRNNEAEVPIAMPAKSRRLMAKLAPRKNAQSVVVGNIFSALAPEAESGRGRLVPAIPALNGD